MPGPKPKLCIECGHPSDIHAGTTAPVKCTWPGCKCSGAVTQLTHRETQILKLTARGFSIKETAYALSITEHTVSLHRMYMMRKLGVHNAVQVMLWALKHDLITRDEIDQIAANVDCQLASRQTSTASTKTGAAPARSISASSSSPSSSPSS